MANTWLKQTTKGKLRWISSHEEWKSELKLMLRSKQGKFISEHKQPWPRLSVAVCCIAGIKVGEQTSAIILSLFAKFPFLKLKTTKIYISITPQQEVGDPHPSFLLPSLLSFQPFRPLLPSPRPFLSFLLSSRPFLSQRWKRVFHRQQTLGWFLLQISHLDRNNCIRKYSFIEQ